MTPERWQQIKALLESALERDPLERDAFLDKACAGDHALRSEVVALIDSHAHAGNFIESPAYEVLAGSLVESDRAYGHSVGPYQSQPLGSGGMGALSRGSKRIGRKVVLKALQSLTKSGARSSCQLEARAASALNYQYSPSRHGRWTTALHRMDLSQRKRGQRMRTDNCRSIAWRSRSCGHGVARSARSGLVHRDIKPETHAAGRQSSERLARLPN